MYAYISENKFPVDADKRYAFVDNLKSIKLNFKNMDGSTINSHRHFQKRLQELTDDELEKMLGILGKYCD
jgi:hypothetical protein